ncbi:unnamed protein product, partial [Ectocarpus sp. 12 AP-2014]
MYGTLTHSQLLSKARKMKVIERKPRVSAATKEKREAARRKARVDAKCKSDPKVLSANFKAAVPSAHKISHLDYYDFLDLKRMINPNTLPKFVRTRRGAIVILKINL